MWIELTPNGKTFVTVYPGRPQGMIIARCLKMFGEPELVCNGETHEEIVHILFPHQDLPEEWIDIAERFMSEHLLDSLGFNEKGGAK